ncbi:MAG: DUF1343 domain-containing protein, partial [Bacteroidota bacterium]
MLVNQKILLAIFFLFSLIQCSPQKGGKVQTDPQDTVKVESSEEMPRPSIQVGAVQMEAYLPKLKGRKVALVVNQTSRVGDVHLVDTLLQEGVDIQRIFAPEHGFRGEADAGEKVADGKDIQTGIRVKSLYGKNKKPSAADVADLDWVVFDIQDVGARFYTYISTMHYVMEACAENGVSFMVLDRPNPNGHYVDGPLRKPGYESFVGLHPIPVVHGMTIAEYAQMINGEGWLKDSLSCQLELVKCKHYDHQRFYELPIRPSPNLPNIRSIYLYPSLCFFEGTVVSIGRGTHKQFQLIGHPTATVGDFTFTPMPMPGAKRPKLEGQQCRGYDLSAISLDSLRQLARLDLDYLLNFYSSFSDKEQFFLKNNFFDKLAGTDQLRLQMQAGKTIEEIRQSWATDLAAF